MSQTKPYDFDTLIERRHTGSAKWNRYPEDVLPMWVADMDFKSPPAVLDALSAAVDHGVFGYMFPPTELADLLVQRMQDRYGWDVTPDDILFVPGVMVGVNLTARAVAQGGAILIQPPVYYPFHYTPAWSKTGKQEAPLTRVETESGFTYKIDFDALEEAITPETKMLLFCSPHNPIGRVWTPDELAQLGEVCERHDLILCSDEIHSDLLLHGNTHTPSVMAHPALRDRTVTLIAPSKTFNLPGLSLSAAIIQNPALRQKFIEAGAGTVMMVMGDHGHPFINMMGYIAATAAYRDGDPWLADVLDYIEGNRETLRAFLAKHIPGMKLADIEGTYLQWIDCRELNLPTTPADWFVEHAGVAFNDGAAFGEGGVGHVRLNLATSRARLERALEQLDAALAARHP